MGTSRSMGLWGEYRPGGVGVLLDTELCLKSEGENSQDGEESKNECKRDSVGIKEKLTEAAETLQSGGLQQDSV